MSLSIALAALLAAGQPVAVAPPRMFVVQMTPAEQGSIASARSSVAEMGKLAVTGEEKRFAAESARIVEQLTALTQKRASGRYLLTQVRHGVSDAAQLQKQNQLRAQQDAYELQMLQLQQKMANLSQAYTMVSNLMKTKHDTAMNSIRNLK